MPKTKLSAKADPHRRLHALIRGYANTPQRTQEELASIFGVTPQTVSKYLSNPEEISHRKLLRIARALDIPPEDFRAAIIY